jgi:thioesterase domain-containing protein
VIDAATLISQLRERDVRLWLDQDQLKFSAPKGALDSDLRETLIGHKQELIAFFRQAETMRERPGTIVAIKPGGSRPPLFVVSGFGGDVYYFLALARLLDPEQPLISVQPPGLDGGEPLVTVEDLARFQIEQIRRYWPQGPYLIAGHCSGGTVAFEVARQLTASGQKVAFLALIGSPFPTMFRPAPQLWRRFNRHVQAVMSGSLEDRRRYIETKLRRRANAANADPSVARVEAATLAAVCDYEPQPYQGCVDFFVTSDEWRQSRRWRDFANDMREHDLTVFTRDELLLGSQVPVLAEALNDRLRAI